MGEDGELVEKLVPFALNFVFDINPLHSCKIIELPPNLNGFTWFNREEYTICLIPAFKQFLSCFQGEEAC